MMHKYTIASICTSGGVFEQGAIANGIEPIWGVEINPRVAEVYQLNYPDSQIIVNDCCKVDWTTLPRPDFLHASPSCRNFSQLNNKVEANKDIAVAQAIADAIAHFKPEVFTLENVAKYQDSESWTVIFNRLKCLGYKVTPQVHRLKYWGVPQKQRNRFIAIASIDSAIALMTPNRTTYWYETIQDLVPDLKRSSLTNTQLNKLSPKTKRAIALNETVLLKRNQIRNYTPAAIESEPYCWSPTATLACDQNENQRALFADLVTPNGTYSLSVRALARIQTIPDSYILPDNIAIAGLIVGNSIPPLFAKQMWGQILKRGNAEVSSAYSTRLLKQSAPSAATLNKYKSIIKQDIQGLVAFEEVGRALIEIRDRSLYKLEGYTNFALFCWDNFQLRKARVYQLIDAAKIVDSIKSTIVDSNISGLTESHCRELSKIKDLKVREEVFQKVVLNGNITAREIAVVHRDVKLKEINKKYLPDLPEVGSVVRLTSKQDLLTKQYNNYWGVVKEKHKFSCDIAVLGEDLSTVHPQDFMPLKDVNPEFAATLLARLNNLYSHALINDTGRQVLIAIASRPYPLLEELDECLLKCLEDKLTIND